MLARKCLDVGKEGVEAFGVGVEDGAVGGDVNAGVGFHVDEADVAEELGFEFLGCEGLDEDDVVLAVAEAFDAILVAVVGEEVGDEDDHAGSLGAEREAGERGV